MSVDPATKDAQTKANATHSFRDFSAGLLTFTLPSALFVAVV